MNRSLNIEKAKSMTAVSQTRSDSSMSSRYEDFFQKSKKSSKIQKISKLNLIISELKKFKTRSSIKSSSLTRLYKEKERVVQNHFAENENRKITKMTRTNFNVQKYTKTKYNRNAIILLFIFSDRNLNLKIFQEIIDVDMRTTKFLYDMMFSTKKTNYRKKAKSFLNSFNDCFLEKFVSYFQIFLKKFRRDSSTQENDLQLNLKRLSKSFFQKNYSTKSLLQFFIKERSIFAFHNWNEKVLNRTSNRYRDEDFKYSKLEHSRSKFNDYFSQKKNEFRQSRFMYNQDRSRIDDYYSKEYFKIDKFQFNDHKKNCYRENQHEKYQISFRQNKFINRYSKNFSFCSEFSHAESKTQTNCRFRFRFCIRLSSKQKIAFDKQRIVSRLLRKKFSLFFTKFSKSNSNKTSFYEHNVIQFRKTFDRVFHKALSAHRRTRRTRFCITNSFDVFFRISSRVT
jgi:hypothetical protein